MVSFVFCSFAFKIVNENEMKRKFYIFGVLAALCLLGTGYYAWTLYNAHCKQVAEWNEGAKAAFEEAKSFKPSVIFPDSATNRLV